MRPIPRVGQISRGMTRPDLPVGVCSVTEDGDLPAGVCSVTEDGDLALGVCSATDDHPGLQAGVEEPAIHLAEPGFSPARSQTRSPVGRCRYKGSRARLNPRSGGNSKCAPAPALKRGVVCLNPPREGLLPPREGLLPPRGALPHGLSSGRLGQLLPASRRDCTGWRAVLGRTKPGTRNLEPGTSQTSPGSRRFLDSVLRGNDGAATPDVGPLGSLGAGSRAFDLGRHFAFSILIFAFALATAKASSRTSSTAKSPKRLRDAPCP